MDKMLIYLLLGGLASVLYRSGAKINKIDPIYSIVIIGGGLLVIGITLMLYNNIKFTNIFSSFSEISGILMLSIGSVLGTLIIMYAMQDSIPMASFLPLYQISSLIMVTLVGILVFRENINLYQGIGIMLSLISIWLIMKK